MSPADQTTIPFDADFTKQHVHRNHKNYHRTYITVTSQWVRWRLKSPASRLFAQGFFRALIKRKHQSSASLAIVGGIHRWPVDSPHKGPVTRKCFHFMTSSWICLSVSQFSLDVTTLLATLQHAPNSYLGQVHVVAVHGVGPTMETS